jgi:hypothetical protein
MSEVIIRVGNLLSSNACTVGTSAVQVSGGPNTNWPLTNVSSSFYPSYRRMVLRFANTHASNSLFVGSNSGITNANGGGWIKEIAPGSYWDDDSNGSMPRWVVGSGSGTTYTLEEYN